MANLRPSDDAESIERSWIRAWFQACIDEYGLYYKASAEQGSRGMGPAPTEKVQDAL